MREACPFNSADYLAGLSHLGRVETRDGVSLLVRTIPGTPLSDGLGSWPYSWFRDARDLARLRDSFADLVTLTVNSQPGFAANADSDPFQVKDHFLYDPSRPAPVLSKRSRAHLRRAERDCTFEIVTAFEDRMALYSLYNEVKLRRGLCNTLFDFPREHFAILACDTEAQYFAVRDAEGIAAITCGVVFGEWMQLVHIAVGAHGLRSDASYLLMQSVLEYTAKQKLVLLMGGIPRANGDGIAQFKTRWSNRREPAFMHRIVNDRARYAELSGARDAGGYFPAYRSPQRATA